MEIVERGTHKKYDLYVVSLLFRDLNLMLLNNRKQVIQRLMGFTKKIYEGHKILSKLSQIYGQSVKKSLSKKVRCTTINEDLVYLSPWSVPSE